MFSIIAVPLFCFLTLVNAQSACDASKAISMTEYYKLYSSGGSSTTSSTSNSNAVGSNSNSDSTDTDLAANNMYNSLGGGGQGGSNAVSIAGRGDEQSLEHQQLEPRASTFNCKDSEVCATAFGSTLWCINPSTGKFHDSLGGSGDIDSFTYTMSNGQVTELASTLTQLPTPTGTGSAATGTGAAARTTGVSAAASTDSASAADRFRVGGGALFVMMAAGLWL